MSDLIPPLLVIAAGLRSRLAHGWAHRHDQDGLGTLELVIITLGLVTVAGVLVAAISAAVTSRTDKIK
jgi:hypothetical protein